jgi:quinohemoprotein ethanol dehydrogenase
MSKKGLVLYASLLALHLGSTMAAHAEIGVLQPSSRSGDSNARATGVDGSNHRLITENAQFLDSSDGRDWPAFGRTYGEQHYSPLDSIDETNVSRLGLAWSLDLDAENTVTGPIAVAGRIYFATGYSVVHAVDVASGKELWKYNPEAAQVSGHKLRQGWGSRGIAYWNGKVFTGTQDGRLIAIDVETGKPVWEVHTFAADDENRFISGPPRAFDGKVIVGHGGADSGNVRGYVTTYDAETGKQLWRFYTVPGNPDNGFENEAMEMAAKTWSGDWWKFGGGGTVWNAMTYDAESDTVFIGTGNGAPWNHRIRSKGNGDNLFLCSIVALDGKTGAYKWHYQINPGESWDYNAAMDMELADLDIQGQHRKVLITAPKNGFVYVIDRTNGKLISAEPFAKVTWASKIDLASGRPVENPLARFPNGQTFTMWPSMFGAHSWQPMAYNPKVGMVYIPVIEMGANFDDKGIDLEHWQRPTGNVVGWGVNLGTAIKDDDKINGTSSLTAWDPVNQRRVWKIPTAGPLSGGVLTTSGNLVFQGQLDGTFSAYAAPTGKLLWQFAAGAPVLAPPITYRVDGKQFLTVLTGIGTSATVLGPLLPKSVDFRTQARRVLTFALNGSKNLPKIVDESESWPEDPTFHPDAAGAARGAAQFGLRCVMCHGSNAVSGGGAPDLRKSSVPLSDEAFVQIVRGGALVSAGMPAWSELTDQQLADIRQYIRAEAQNAQRSSAARSK